MTPLCHLLRAKNNTKTAIIVSSVSIVVVMVDNRLR